MEKVFFAENSFYESILFFVKETLDDAIFR